MVRDLLENKQGKASHYLRMRLNNDLLGLEVQQKNVNKNQGRGWSKIGEALTVKNIRYPLQNDHRKPPLL